MKRSLTLLAALLLLTLPGLALADFSFIFDVPETEAETDTGILYQFHNSIINMGDQDDTYHVVMSTNTPADWATSMCEGETCYPPFIHEIDVDVPVGQSVNLDLDMTPLSAGVGYVTLTVTDQGGAGSTQSADFTLGTTGTLTSVFDFMAQDMGAVVTVGQLEAFHASLTNTSGTTDVYQVTLAKNHPADWISSICEGETCYPPFITDVEVTLGADELANLDFDFTPLSVGEGTMTITITSTNTPSASETYEFKAVTPGLDVLIVDGEAGTDHESYFQAAVSAMGKSHATWSREDAGLLSNLEMAEFPLIVWNAGNGHGGLTTDDFSSLSYQIEHGGGVLLSGTNLASSFCDSGSEFYTPGSHNFFTNVLGADYDGLSLGAGVASGPSGDPVTDGLSFFLGGGDGADNNAFVDGIVPDGSGVTTLLYDNGDIGAVRNQFSAGRTCLLSFAFEGIETAAGRADLMDALLVWLANDTSPVGDMVQPLLSGVPYASPNPFNPQTSIRFEVGGDTPASALVDIFDLRGQKIRTLHSGHLNPGPQSLVWDGRADDGRQLATGVYMARVQVGGMAETVKMSLVK